MPDDFAARQLTPDCLSGQKSEEHAAALCVQETARSRTTLASFLLFGEGTSAYCGAGKPKKPTGWSFSDRHFCEPCRTCRQGGSSLSSSPSVGETALHPPVGSQYQSYFDGGCASGFHASFLTSLKEHGPRSFLPNPHCMLKKGVPDSSLLDSLPIFFVPRSYRGEP